MLDNIKRLHVFGDSWARGSELAEGENTFGELLSNKLSCDEFNNYATPASSINHLLLQFRSFVARTTHLESDLADWTVLFFLTEPGRTFTIVDGTTVFLNPDGGYGLKQDSQLEEKINTNYWKYIHCDTTSILTANSTVYNLQNLCKHYNICDYYVQGWTEFEFWSEIDTDKIYKQGKVTCSDLIQGNKASGGHPNQKGHQLIADALYQWFQDEPR